MSAPEHAATDTSPSRTEVSLPAPRFRGVSITILLAWVIAALGIGFAAGSIVAGLG